MKRIVVVCVVMTASVAYAGPLPRTVYLTQNDSIELTAWPEAPVNGCPDPVRGGAVLIQYNMPPLTLPWAPANANENHRWTAINRIALT